MSTFEKCPVCKEYDFLDDHKCLPIYEVDMYEEDDWMEVHAYDHKGAVEKACQKYDNMGDYDIITDGGKDSVCVRKQGEKIIKTFYVEAYSEPTYNACEVENEKEENEELDF